MGKNIYRNAREALDAERLAKKQNKSMAEVIARNFGHRYSIDRLLEKQARRAARREAKLPKNRRCPICKLTKIENSRWAGSICKSCSRLVGEKTMASLHFKELPATYIVNPRVLTQVVKKSGLTSMEVARRCGWSRSKQSKLENGLLHTLSFDDYAKLTRYLDILLDRAPAQYLIARDSLQRVRKNLGVSMRDFATHLKIHMSRMQRVEKGIAPVSEQEKEKIERLVEVLNG